MFIGKRMMDRVRDSSRQGRSARLLVYFGGFSYGLNTGNREGALGKVLTRVIRRDEERAENSRMGL